MVNSAKLSRLTKQKGAVMLETAYILPILLAVILFTVEVVGYALNSLAANDVLTDVHTRILTEVAKVSNLEPGEDLESSVTFASCSSGKVVIPTGNNSDINSIVTSALASKNISFIASDPAQTVINKSVVSGFDVYVINFTGTANSLVVPTILAELLPINVDTVISIKDSCS